MIGSRFTDYVSLVKRKLFFCFRPGKTKTANFGIMYIKARYNNFFLSRQQKVQTARSDVEMQIMESGFTYNLLSFRNVVM